MPRRPVLRAALVLVTAATSLSGVLAATTATAGTAGTRAVYGPFVQTAAPAASKDQPGNGVGNAFGNRGNGVLMSPNGTDPLGRKFQ